MSEGIYKSPIMILFLRFSYLASMNYSYENSLELLAKSGMVRDEDLATYDIADRMVEKVETILKD